MITTKLESKSTIVSLSLKPLAFRDRVFMTASDSGFERLSSGLGRCSGSEMRLLWFIGLNRECVNF